MAVTSLQQPLCMLSHGGCCRKVALYKFYLAECPYSKPFDNTVLIRCLDAPPYFSAILTKGRLPVIEPMMGLRPHQGNLRLVFRLFKFYARLDRVEASTRKSQA